MIWSYHDYGLDILGCYRLLLKRLRGREKTYVTRSVASGVIETIATGLKLH
jgi:hypothetical protein